MNFKKIFLFSGENRWQASSEALHWVNNFGDGERCLRGPSVGCAYREIIEETCRETQKTRKVGRDENFAKNTMRCEFKWEGQYNWWPSTSQFARTHR